jgi:hypothetical protein
VKAATQPSWRAAAALAVNRVLKKIDQSPSSESASRAVPPAPANEPIAAERVELPPLDFRTGLPVEIKASPAPEPAQKPSESTPPRRVEKVSVLDDAGRQRIRDTYVAARFPGVARSSHDLADVEHVTRAAQVYLRDANPRRAEEILELAYALQPEADALLLARLDVALQLGDTDGYRRTALRFRNDHPRSAHWKYIVAFARTLYLTEPPFTLDVRDEFVESTYQRPNWIGNSWELEPEFSPRDLRARVLAALPEAEAHPTEAA